MYTISKLLLSLVTNCNTTNPLTMEKTNNKQPKKGETVRECDVCRYRDNCPIANVKVSFELFMKICKHWN